MKTHYEMFTGPLADLQPKTQRYLEEFAKCDEVISLGSDGVPFKIRDCPGAWFSIFCAPTSRRKLPFLRSAGNGQHDFEAMSLAMYRLLYTAGRAPEAPLSLMTTLLTNKEFLFHQSIFCKVVGESNGQTAAEIAYQVVSHERAGKMVYEVTPGLAEKLLYTELRGLKCDDIRLPHTSIYITVPPNTEFKVHNVETGWHDLIGIYITEDPKSVKEPDGIALEENSLGRKIVTDDGVKFEDREKIREWTMMFVGGPGKDAQGHPLKDDDAVYYFRMGMRDGQSLDDAIGQVDFDYDPRKMTKEHWDLMIGQMQRQWKEIFRWAVNVMIYATYSEPGEPYFNNPKARKLWERIEAAPEGSRTRRNLTRKAKGQDPQKRFLLGKDIVVDRSKPENQPGKSTGFKTSVRVRVSGFWRRQPYGKNRSLRRMQFIQPFWRGPEGGDVFTKKHVLK